MQVGTEIFVGVLVFAIFAWMREKGRRSSGRPRDVMRYLKKPGDKHTIRHRGAFEGSSGLWNPAQPWGPTTRLYGSGKGTYWVDTAGMVNLEWQPRGGDIQHFAGPAPARPDANSPARRRARGILLAGLGVYLIAATAGFIVGYEVAAGPPSHRAGVGLIGAFVGYLGVYVVLITVLGVVRVRRGRKVAR